MDEQNDDKKPLQTTRLNPPDLDRSETVIMSGNNPLVRKLMDKAAAQEGADTVDEKREIVLVVRGIPERVSLSQGQTVVVGRADLSTGYKPGVDLTPYDAQKRGVSREHVRLHREGQHVFVTDLGSANGTILAGKRLLPDQPTLVHNGDELLLGGLAVKVLFD